LEERRKTKQNKDLARSQASLLFDAELPRKQIQIKFCLFSLKDAGVRGSLFGLLPCTLVSPYEHKNSQHQALTGTERQRALI
jgi:hypothetical protein